MSNDMPPVGSLNSKRGAEGSTNVTANKERPKIGSAVKHSATIHKKRLGEKFTEAFVKEDIKSVTSHLIKEKLIPDLICMVRDTIWDGITMHFGLGGSRSTSGYFGKPGYTNYSAASVSSYAYKGSGGSAPKQQQPTKQTGPQNFRDICFRTEEDATDALGSLRHYAKQYQGYASVSDLYEAANLTAKDFTDNNWGWNIDMLDGGKVYRRMIDGQLLYCIELPNPIPVD